MWKNVHPVYSAGIQTHDLWNMRRPGLPPVLHKILHGKITDTKFVIIFTNVSIKSCIFEFTHFSAGGWIAASTLLKNGPNPASFCLFSFFSQCKDKSSTNLIIDGVLGRRTRDSRMEGADESAELWRHLHPVPFTAKVIKFLLAKSCLFNMYNSCGSKYNWNKAQEVKTNLVKKWSEHLLVGLIQFRPPVVLTR